MELNKNCNGCCEGKLKSQPRDAAQIAKLKTRLNKIVGQIQGISKMIEEQKYCSDVLIQVSAAEKALRAVGFELLKDHLNTCVSEQIKNGNQEIVDETIDIIKRF